MATYYGIFTINPDIILGFRWNRVIENVTIGTTLMQHQNKYSAVGLFGVPKDLSWITKMLAGQKLKFYLYQNEEWFILNKQNIFLLNIFCAFTN